MPRYRALGHLQSVTSDKYDTQPGSSFPCLQLGFSNIHPIPFWRTSTGKQPSPFLCLSWCSVLIQILFIAIAVTSLSEERVLLVPTLHKVTNSSLFLLPHHMTLATQPSLLWAYSDVLSEQRLSLSPLSATCGWAHSLPRAKAYRK